jgi:hypothetical protein
MTRQELHPHPYIRMDIHSGQKSDIVEWQVVIGIFPVITIRAAVVTMSSMLRDIISELPSGQRHLEIVAEFATRDLLHDRLHAVHPDLVLVELARGETDRIARTILAAVPCARVVAFSGGGRHVYIHEMRPHRRAMSNISARAIIRALYAPNLRRVV